MDLVKSLALTVHVFTTLAEHSETAPFDSLQKHAVRTARVAKQLLRGEQAQQAFTSALLHDVGHLILAICIPERYKVIVETSRSENRPLHEVETEVFGFTHAEVGAYLLGLWGLPFTIVEAVAFHHNPSAAGEKTFGVTSATALADSLVDSLTTGSARRFDAPGKAGCSRSTPPMDQNRGGRDVGREPLVALRRVSGLRNRELPCAAKPPTPRH